MRCILTTSRADGEGQRALSRLRAARELVGEAVRTLASGSEGAALGSLNRIAATLTTRLVQDLLSEDERKQTAELQERADVQSDRDGFHGYSWAISLPDLLGFLQMQQTAGVLQVNIGSEVISLIFDGGDLIHACSDNSPPGCRLGEILVAQGVLSIEDLERFLLRSGGGRMGDALERAGLATKEELRAALDHQVEQIFHRLFAAQGAYFRFRAGHTEDTVRMRLNIFQLLLETCRVRDEAQPGAVRDSA